MIDCYKAIADHMLRFYVKNPNIPFEANRAERNNWSACDRACRKFFRSKVERKTILALYINNNIYNEVSKLSYLKQIKQDDIWLIIGKLRQMVLKERGLI